MACLLTFPTLPIPIWGKNSMRRENQSSVSQFLLLGLPHLARAAGHNLCPLPGLIPDNLLIILLVRLDPCLHNPMYFFLITWPSQMSPLQLPLFQRGWWTCRLSNNQSPMQGAFPRYIFFTFYFLDNFLLTVMAYDRYVAICQPLHYSTIMRQELCVSLVAGSWFLCCIYALLHTLLLVQLSFSVDNTIPHSWNLIALLKLSCSDTSLNELVIFPVRRTLLILPWFSILGSYIHIGPTLLSVSSTKRLFKVCSTCGFHHFAVSLYYRTLANVSFFSSSWDSNDKDVTTSVVYAVVTPMLNPFIYSLRNRDIKESLEIFVNMPTFLKCQSLNPHIVVMSTVRSSPKISYCFQLCNFKWICIQQSHIC